MIVAAALCVFVLGGAWYLCVERPTLMVRDAINELTSALEVGDHVETRGGLQGIVVSITNPQAVIELRTQARVTIELESITARRPARATSSEKPQAYMQILGTEFSGAASRWFGNSYSTG